ncbi:MAG: ABC transporter permease [Candidatus Limivicinus sp.]|nr:ABC transporter permease [Candidatus Limivicinus sp.]
MLCKLIRAELMKLKRSPLWLAFVILPVIPAVMGTFNYLANINILQSEWYSLWTQHTLFTDYFFLPVLIGIYCSFIMAQEVNNHNWNRVLTMPVPRSLVYMAKLVCAAMMILLSEIWIGALFVLSGKLTGMTAPLPVKELCIWCAFGTLGGTVMAGIQLVISLFIRSFALPVGIALAGGLSGLVFLTKDLGHIWPYSLMAYGMNSNSPQELLASGYAQFVMICLIYIVGVAFAGSVIISRREL